MPVFFFTAFAGGLVAVSDSPGFDYPSYTTFQYVFVLIQSAVFGGVFAGFSIAADFESGFARRLMLGTRGHSALVIGYTISALFRAMVVWGVVTVIALLAGAEVTGSGLDITETISVAMLTNIAALLFSCGVAMRMRTMQAAPLIQLPATVGNLVINDNNYPGSAGREFGVPDDDEFIVIHVAPLLDCEDGGRHGKPGHGHDPVKGHGQAKECRPARD